MINPNENPADNAYASRHAVESSMLMTLIPRNSRIIISANVRFFVPRYNNPIPTSPAACVIPETLRGDELGGWRAVR